MKITTLREEIERVAAQAREELHARSKKADEENRTLNDDDHKTLDPILEQGRKLKADLAKLEGDEALALEIDRLTSSAMVPARPRQVRSMGQQFVESPAYDFFRKKQHHTTSAWRSPTVELFYGATLTEDPASGGALVLPDTSTGLVPPLPARYYVADLLAPGTTTSNAVNYMKETVWTNAAAAVAEGAAKPESTLTFAPVSDPVRKLAHWLPVSEEMLEDAPQIRSYIDARLRGGIMAEEEDQLLNGSGVAPNILGLNARPGLAPAVVRIDPETNADAIYKQIAAIATTQFIIPDGITINPTNWQAILLSKNDSGDYYGPGPFAPQAARSVLWGLPVAPSPAEPLGEALVGSYRTAAQLFRRGGIRVEASNSHADYFIKNLVAIRAEERLALAVYRPGAFGKVTTLTPVVP